MGGITPPAALSRFEALVILRVEIVEIRIPG
jgi:hypothetical protein